MAEVRPFHGVRYNQSLVKDLASVICPPYDIISPEQQLELYKKSRYNFVRLEHTQVLPQDTASNNKYTRAAATLKEWLKRGILKKDETPAIYLHEHSFTYQLKEYWRRIIIARVRLEEWDKMIVRPHENTMSAPKSDRLNLMWALQANISPVLAMYEDPGDRISTLLAAQESGRPLFDIKMYNGEGHRLWAVTGRDAVGQISKALANQPLYIADGHHRYESALTYKRERLACSPQASADEPFNFVMMNLLDFSDPGLLILPTHRLVRGLPESIIAGFRGKLDAFFEVAEIPVRMPISRNQIDDLFGADKDRLIIFGFIPDKFLVLKPHNSATLDEMMPQFHTELYKRLMLSIGDHVILEKILTIDSEKEKTALGYKHDSLDAIKGVLNHEYQLALLLSPVKAGAIKAIADAGDRMPRKSTYFYPKAPAGLVFNLLS